MGVRVDSCDSWIDWLASIGRGRCRLFTAGRFLARRLGLWGFGLPIICRRARHCCQAALVEHFAANLFQEGGILAEVLFGVLAALSEAHLAVAQPSAALLD